MDKVTDEIQEEEVSLEGTQTLFHGLGTVDEVVDRYTRCNICGSNLHFNYFTDFAKNMTQEVAKCPECGEKARNVIHRLQ